MPSARDALRRYAQDAVELMVAWSRPLGKYGPSNEARWLTPPPSRRESKDEAFRFVKNPGLNRECETMTI